MKKVIGLLIAVLAILTLSSYGNNVTKKDLRANDWIIESNNSKDPNIIATFSENKVFFVFDTDNFDTSANQEWTKSIKKFAKSIVDQMNYSYNYDVEKNQLTLENADEDNKNKIYDMSKDGENIVLKVKEDSTDSNDSSTNKKDIILKPYKKLKIQQIA